MMSCIAFDDCVKVYLHELYVLNTTLHNQLQQYNPLQQHSHIIFPINIMLRSHPVTSIFIKHNQNVIFQLTLPFDFEVDLFSSNQQLLRLIHVI